MSSDTDGVPHRIAVASYWMGGMIWGDLCRSFREISGREPPESPDFQGHSRVIVRVAAVMVALIWSEGYRLFKSREQEACMNEE